MEDFFSQPDSPDPTRGRSPRAPGLSSPPSADADGADGALYDPLNPLSPDRPLADRMRPVTLDEYVGQERMVGPESVLRRLIERDALCSMIFWGPPGSGKTTLATLVARLSQAAFVPLSAVAAGVKDVKTVTAGARDRLRREDRKTILFLDEIHRFNKAQQDALLPAVESGLLLLIGATTENPSFSIIAPLLSRCRVFTLEALSEDQMVTLLQRALSDSERGLGALAVEADDTVLRLMTRLADGDARRALNLLDLAARSVQPNEAGRRAIDGPILEEISQRSHLVYDKSGEEHFNLISALHKSLRASDVQAAAYWCGRILQSGEAARYVARRLIRFASEDVGLADPNALTVALNGWQAYQQLGSPEGELAIVQVAVYLAASPKSNALYMAEKAVRAEIAASGSLPAPLHIRNAPTGLMKTLGYGKGYVYDHDAPDRFSGQECLPDALRGARFYEPVELGFEREIKKRMDYWQGLREKRQGRPTRETGDGDGGGAAE